MSRSLGFKMSPIMAKKFCYITPKKSTFIENGKIIETKI